MSDSVRASMDSCRTSSVILRSKLSAAGSIDSEGDRAHTLAQLALPWRRRPPLAIREQLDLLVRLQFAAAPRQQIADKVEHRRRTKPMETYSACDL